jgi:hypothetical protein
MDQHSDPQYKTDDGSALRIWRDAAINNFLTEREGRPIYDEVVYVEVISPGSGNSTPIFEAIRYLAPEAKQKEPLYRVKYPDFKKYIEDFDASEKHDASLSGTPLSQWSEMNRSMVASLKAQKIFTVDALANLPDGKLNVIGPDGRTWREKAKAYLESSKSDAYATALAADLEKARQDNADLQAQLKEMADRVTALEADGGDKDDKKPKIPPPLKPII